MLNSDEIAEKLQTLTVEQLANGLGITMDSLSWHLRHNGISARDIKHDYAIEIVDKLRVANGRTGIARLTGFTLRKVDKYLKLVKNTNKLTG